MLRSPCGMTTSSSMCYWETSFYSCSTFLAVDLRNWCKTSWEYQFLSFLSFHRNRKSAASLEACLLMMIKTLAYGVPTHTFLDYFQMSEEFGRRAWREFDAVIKQCYVDESLHLPTATDIKSSVKLHKSQHNFDRMFGSLDWTHTYWKIVQRLGIVQMFSHLFLKINF